VDGAFHGDRLGEDARRTAWLEKEGYRVLRIQAVEVLTDITAVLERLLIEIPREARDVNPRGRKGSSSGPSPLAGEAGWGGSDKLFKPSAGLTRPSALEARSGERPVRQAPR